MAEIFLFGAGGHAKVVADIVEREGRNHIAFLIDDDVKNIGASILGHPVIGERMHLLAEDKTKALKGIVTIGDNYARCSAISWLIRNGFSLDSAIHPAAVVGKSADILDGVVVMANAVINTDARIKRGVIVNTSASVDHDCCIEEGAHIAPGAILCGGVYIGRNTIVGAGAVLCPGVHVGREVVIGAGATVVNDIVDGQRVFGTPAKPR